MVTIIKTEFMKLKRYFIVWIGVSLMLLTVLLTLFTTMADDGMVWDYQFLFEQVVKHFVTMIFPMCIFPFKFAIACCFFSLVASA